MKTTLLITSSLLSLMASAAFADALSDSYLAMFKPLPEVAPSQDNELTEAKTNLGRMLYYETRLSKNGKMSCNSCHMLDKFGQDNLPFSPGHEGKLGGRSSPTVYNAALHIAQFWDGRATTVEEQAKGPVLNPVEMGMASANDVVAVLKSIPGYVEAFKAAFPGEAEPVNYDNFGKAVGAFERRLVTPSRWDDYLRGRKEALTVDEQKGYETFAKAGCATCHNGPAIGGAMYHKLGLVKAWPGLKDLGRYEATHVDGDKHFFKVSGLRNVTETGPYLHDGSVKTLEDMVRMMGEHQLGKMLTDEETASIVTFLKSLKGEIPKEYIAQPKLPASGPNTPKA
ncbi:cytochrome c peroxidase [Prosthecobacter fusiformis]|uniref:Cytochrome c peroxidase n=1 Tax=Prosthecobacter fusiformis TaxID=48464 RepID=A0A4R7RTT7_9BACT|nr:cytochrome-c peroxidase [Prosthecobacter fusiformis]TDU68195.1 cytochrome c peroxidase [Prosthecobacter fusiformis]